MPLIGIAFAMLVGVTLGFFGGGGAVLTVPIFVYVLHVPVKSAVPMALFVVGASSAIGAITRWRAKRLHPRQGLGFGVAAMSGAFIGARVGVGISARAQLVMFAAVLLAAAASFVRSAKKEELPRRRGPLGLDYGAFALIGMLTGMIGIGGGFLFVPALVTLIGIPVSDATGISLMVIAMNALAGFAGYQGRVEIDWTLALSFGAVVIASMLIAGRYSARVPVAVFKRAFAAVLVAVGALVLIQNIR